MFSCCLSGVSAFAICSVKAVSQAVAAAAVNVEAVAPEAPRDALVSFPVAARSPACTVGKVFLGSGAAAGALHFHKLPPTASSSHVCVIPAYASAAAAALVAVSKVRNAMLMVCSGINEILLH